MANARHRRVFSHSKVAGRCSSIQSGVSLRLVPAMPKARAVQKRVGRGAVGMSEEKDCFDTPLEARASMTSVEPVKSSP